ncbi:MAG: response regulator [Deltaproteobacteria bacterium]|nr:response regulator [Deltaproteobacteria bacterium]MBW2150581.1 response regulator [Deltaproteobacteria bacterium]
MTQTDAKPFTISGRLKSNDAHTGKRRPRVLVVDDDIEIRRAVWYILRSEFDVTAVENGYKAVERIRQGERFEVASLDLRMPGMSGVDTLKEIKQLDPTIEVLIMTAHSDVQSAKKALRFGAYDYIDKPFRKDAYREAIRRGVKRREKSTVSDAAKEQLAFVKAQLKISEKFAVIGQLSAGIVHDLNNALNSVLGFSDLLLMEDAPVEEARDYIKQINKAAKLSISIVQKLLTFSRNQGSEREPLQINEVINSCLELKQHDFSKHQIEVVKELEKDLPMAMANFHDIQQVVLNILNNAEHAMMSADGSKRLTIKSTSDAKAIRFSIEDTGIGIPEKNLQRIFEPLFTTKEKDVGTGLGLSVCYDIVQDHNGTIYVASEPGKGTCFVIELPHAAL